MIQAFWLWFSNMWDCKVLNINNSTLWILNKSASVFIKNSMSYLKSQVLNDIEMIPFFEKLLSEAKEFRHNDTFADLFDIAEDSTLFDSPFKQISSRWKQDVADFIDILTNLIEINNSNLNVINKTFKWSKVAAQILFEMFTYARDKNLPSLLTVIDVISSNVKIEYVIDQGISKLTIQGNTIIYI